MKRKRRRKWKAPNDPTPQAKQVWQALFPGHSWPRGWKVAWAGFMRGALGLTIYTRRLILLSHGDHAGPTVITHRNRFVALPDGTQVRAQSYREGPVETLLHELVHVRAGHTLRHGREFRALENGLRARLGLEPAP